MPYALLVLFVLLWGYKPVQRVLNLASIVQLDRDFGMAFDTGHWVDDNFLRHKLILLSLPIRVVLTNGARHVP